ncbi:hypothetical protein H2200_000629 [Cladophialophora chaetospira]|uniref:Uncharacterized protein n=1 Tax=Cladophialophora chaetospira TaxID=386627 RepID=A0AA38XNW6_9EURO|nr:hypothetical protein H2200_000629 [Cladophialophora chaetospira]
MAQCYDHDTVTNTQRLLGGAWIQCPSGNGCCVVGDQCLDYNLCHYTHDSNSTQGRFSTYYVSRCTDPTYTGPDCPQACSAPGPPDAVYNYTTQEWACCGTDSEGKISCDAPTENEVFQAPAPSDLVVLSPGVALVSTQTLMPGPRTSSSTSSSSSSSTTESSSTTASSSAPSTIPSTTTSLFSTSTSAPSSTNTPTPIQQNRSSDGLSTGAKAGIGVGVALGVLTIVALLALFLLRRRKRRNDATTSEAKYPPNSLEAPNQQPPYTQSPLYEVPSSTAVSSPDAYASAANGTKEPYELDSSNRK